MWGFVVGWLVFFINREKNCSYQTAGQLDFYPYSEYFFQHGTTPPESFPTFAIAYFY